MFENLGRMKVKLRVGRIGFPVSMCAATVTAVMLSVAAPVRGESSLLQQAFAVGEKLDFKVYFEFILGGFATMAIEEIDTVDSHPCYHIVSTARSTPTVDAFYRVRDRIETWRDVEGGFSRRYGKFLREGKYRTDKRVFYKPESSLVVLHPNSTDLPDSFHIEGYVQDVLSAFYEVRTRDLKVGESVWIDVHDIKKRYDLEVRVLRRERVKTPAGRFDCLVIEPLLKSSGIFRREGNMRIWLTDDRHHIPVMMKSKLYFGAVYAKLIGYRLGGS